MTADFPQTAGWTSCGWRRRFPVNGERGRAAGGGGSLFARRRGKRQTENFSKHGKTNEGGGAPLLLFSRSVLLSRCTQGSRNEETRRFF